MTGNKIWRAPLAGLASVAMIATMCVTALTANAASVPAAEAKLTFKIGDETVATKTGRVGDTYADAMGGYSVAEKTSEESAAGTSSKFVGWTVNGKLVDLNSDVAGDVTLTARMVKNTEAVRMEFKPGNGIAAENLQFPEGSNENTDGSVYWYVEQGQSINAQRIPQDVADGKLVTSWVAGDETVSSLTEITNVTDPDGFVVIPQTVEANAKTFTMRAASGVAGHVKGALSDGDKYTAYSVDTVSDKVTVPEFIATGSKTVKNWVDEDNPANGTTYAAGDEVTLAKKATYLIANGSDEYFTVSFDSNGGSSVASQSVVSGGYATLPSDPSREGYNFKGWVYNDEIYTTQDDFDNLKITSDVNFTAKWVKNTAVQVTFKDVEYNGKNADVKITVNAGDYIDASQAPAWTRKGYVLAGWTKAEDPSAESAKFDFTTEQIVDGTKNFTLRPIWTKVSVDQADAALRYVQVAIDGEYKRDDSKFFTADSFKAFKGVYTKAYQTYKNMDYTSPSISAEQSAQIVSDLKAGWAQLEFDNSAENTDEIYRLASGWDGRLHHVLTGSAYEAAVLTNTITTDGVGGWVKEASPFRAFASDSKVVELFADFPVVSDNGVQSDELSEVATPLVVLAQRVYNAELNEHMYTTDTNEVDTITKNGWSKDQESSSFYVPTNKTETPVYRLYNKVSHLHLFTASQNEYNTLLQNPDWNDEGIKFYGIA